VLVPKTEYSLVGSRGACSPEKCWNQVPEMRIPAFWGDGYTNSEDCKVPTWNTWFFMIISRFKGTTVYIEIKNFTLVFIENLAKAKLVKLRHSINIYPLIICTQLFIPFWHIGCTKWSSVLDQNRTDSINTINVSGTDVLLGLMS
jgi:hypothetical protein